VNVNAGSGLSLALIRAAVSIHGDWSYRYRLGFIDIRDSGSFDVQVSQLSLSVTVTLGSSSVGVPTIQSTGCSCHINHLDIQLHGGASWLYDLFISSIEGSLKSNLENKLCEAARHAIDVDAASELSTLEVQTLIDRQWLLDYRLVSSPVFGAGFLESYHKGEFFHVDQPTEAPFEPADLPSTAPSDRMVTFWISDYVLNTAGYVLHKNNVLAYNLTQQDLPENEKYYLNTTCCFSCQCIGKILPQVAKMFPNESVVAHMSTSQPPTVNITPTKVCGNFTGIITLFVGFSNGTLGHLFTMSIDAKVVIIPRFDGSVLKANVSRIEQNITIINSSIGRVASQTLTFIFNYAKKVFVIPKLNTVGNKGFPIPRTRHVSFTNTDLQFLVNCARLQSDVQYEHTLFFKPGS
jgi:lipopolysaccharide-binding protein